jgi:ubiquinone/menaquinone biosynthesis C-methylase UbiE
MKIGNFDTDSKALNNRVDIQNKLSSFDLNKWIFHQLNPFKRSVCLDLGCGLGNQTLPLAEITGESGHIFSIDYSKKSLQSLEKDAIGLNVNKQITTHCCELDNIGPYLDKKKFDCIVGSYSLYYVKNAEKMFLTIRDILKTEGVLFFCGPSHKNNFELRSLIAKISADNNIKDTIASRFMEKESQYICRKLFSKVRITTFENPVIFLEPESLMTYWRSLD